MAEPGSPGSGGRVVALDGMRGIAALIVVIGHSYGALRSPPGVAGPSVQTFFVLSGYCLAASALRGDGMLARAQYFVRRIFRIHPPFVFALLLAWFASFLPPVLHPMFGASKWIIPYTQKHLAPSELLGYLTFPSAADGQMPIGWTLEVEMIFSLLLPLMVLVARKIHWSVLVGVALAAIAQKSPFHYSQVYALHFSLGIALYEERDRLARWAAHAPWLMGMVVLACFAYFTSIGLMRTPRAINITSIIWPLFGGSTWIAAMAIAAAFLTAGAAHLHAIGAFFAWRPIAFLGRISYSVYLLHFTILLVAVRLLERKLTDGEVALFVAAICAASIVAATAAYYAMELPSIRLGNQVCAGIARWAHGRAQLSRIGSSDEAR